MIRNKLIIGKNIEDNIPVDCCPLSVPFLPAICYTNDLGLLYIKMN